MFNTHIVLKVHSVLSQEQYSTLVNSSQHNNLRKKNKKDPFTCSKRANRKKSREYLKHTVSMLTSAPIQFLIRVEREELLLIPVQQNNRKRPMIPTIEEDLFRFTTKFKHSLVHPVEHQHQQQLQICDLVHNDHHQHHSHDKLNESGLVHQQKQHVLFNEIQMFIDEFCNIGTS